MRHCWAHLPDYWQDEGEESQQRGAPTHVAPPYVINVALNTNGFAALQVGIGVVAVELDRASLCGPIKLNNGPVLYPGETQLLGRADGGLEIEAAWSELPTGAGAPRQTAGPGLLLPIAKLVMHRDRRTVPPGASRSTEITATGFEPSLEFVAGVTREIVQIVADGYRKAVCLAWDRGAATYTGFVELVWSPRSDRGFGPSYSRVEAQPPQVVPAGSGVGIVLYDGDTRGCSIVRVVGQLAGGTAQAFAEIRLTASP